VDRPCPLGPHRPHQGRPLGLRVGQGWVSALPQGPRRASFWGHVRVLCLRIHVPGLDPALWQPRVPGHHPIRQLPRVRPLGQKPVPLGAIMKHRGSRTKTGPVILTGRDDDLLTLIGLAGYVSTAQLARELFPSADRCRRRCRQLFDAGYLRVTLAGSTSANLVSLSPEGLRLLSAKHPELAARLRLSGIIRLAGVEHHLGLVDTRLYAAGLATHGIRLLRWEGPHGGLGQALGLADEHLEPDGLAEFETPRGSVACAVEVDCGTESPQVLATKLERYRNIMPRGGLGELWVVMTGGRQRREAVEHLVRSKGLAEWTRVMDMSHTTARPVRPLPGVVDSAGHGPKGPNYSLVTA